MKKIGDVLTEILKDWRCETLDHGVYIKENWKEIVGDIVYKNTQVVGIKNKILRVTVKSSAWAMELSFIKDKIMEKINRLCGKNVVEDIYFKEM
jgi:predicted nucleic acid-binding Zn ribbon protein